MEWADEKDYKRDFSEALRFHGMKVDEHEDKHSNFIPDLSFANGGVEGWIEVKYLDSFPKTLDSIKHWTAGQEKWLVDQGRAGTGWCFLLVGTPKLHALFRYGCLSTVRHQPYLTQAVNTAWDKDYIYSALAERFVARARRRVSAAIEAGVAAGGVVLPR